MHKTVPLLTVLLAAVACSRTPLSPGGHECERDSDCDDGLACNGTEHCVHGFCAPGEPIDCSDGDACTRDRCVEPGQCRHRDFRVDADGDGFWTDVQCGRDCDDAAPAVHPGAPERCNARDDDCDGRIDEGTRRAAQGSSTAVSEGMRARSAADLAWSPPSETWGATYTDARDGTSLWFVQLDAQGRPRSGPRRISAGPADVLGAELVWAGDRYGLLWPSRRRGGDYELYFTQLTADGQRVRPDVRVTRARRASIHPSMIWTGGEYAVAWQDKRGSRTRPQIFLAFLDARGRKIGSDRKVADPSGGAFGPALAQGSQHLAIAYTVQQDGGRHIRFVATDLTGERVGPSTRLSEGASQAVRPAVAWHRSAFAVLWRRDGRTQDLVGTRVRVGPSFETESPVPIVAGPSNARAPALTTFGRKLFVTWTDDRTERFDLYAGRLDTGLGLASGTHRLTTDPAHDAIGIAAAGPGDLGVLFSSFRTGQREPFFTRLRCLEP